MKASINYYRRIYLRYGMDAIMFLFMSKFKTKRTELIYLKNIKFPITLSNFKCDVTTLFQIFFGGEYNFKLKAHPRIIIDCGANIGLSAVFFANKYPEAKIIAIEPDINNFNHLKINTSNYTNIICLQKAVWPSSTSLQMVDPGIGGWGLRTHEATNGILNNVDGIAIDEILQQFNIESIDLIKIDIEAAEKELFSKNYESWLGRTKAIAIELHDFIDPTISAIFFKAISTYNFETSRLGENVICIRSNEMNKKRERQIN